jgi:hypothetical protein
MDWMRDDMELTFESPREAALNKWAYIFDDSVMVFAATWALSSKRLTPAAGRTLKGLSGLVLLVLSLLLILKPEWLIFTT